MDDGRDAEPTGVSTGAPAAWMPGTRSARSAGTTLAGVEGAGSPRAAREIRSLSRHRDADMIADEPTSTPREGRLLSDGALSSR